MTYQDFLTHVSDLIRIHREWRFGQTVFNALYQVRPDLADQIRGTGIDPFYRDDVAKATLHWIERHW